LGWRIAAIALSSCNSAVSSGFVTIITERSASLNLAISGVVDFMRL
jgi:hypothetical protein